MEAEGWYLDPYQLHNERWFSAGEPTSLVRDHGVESRDEPPDRPCPDPTTPTGNNLPMGSVTYATPTRSVWPMDRADLPPAIRRGDPIYGNAWNLDHKTNPQGQGGARFIWAWLDRRRVRRLRAALTQLHDAFVGVMETSGDPTDAVAVVRSKIAAAAPDDRRLWDVDEQLAYYEPHDVHPASIGTVKTICRQALCGLGDHTYCTHRVV